MSDKLREALKKSAQGWANVLELSLLPERHRKTAEALRDEALAALAQPQNDAEAAAWRYRYELKEDSWGTWTVQKNKPNWFEPTMTDVQVEPLFTAPPSHERMRDALQEATVSSCGHDITIQCNSHAVKGVILNALSRAGDNHASDGKESEGVTSVTVSREGIAKMMDAVENPKQPSEKLKEIMREHRHPSAPTPAQERREEIARILEPQAWAALGIGDTGAYKNRRTSSLRKADRILALPPAPKGEPSREWPAWCHSPSSCSRNLRCMYVGCKHGVNTDIKSKIEAAALRREPEGER